MRLAILFLFFSLSAFGQTLVIQEPCPTNGGSTLVIDESFQQSGGQTMVVGELVCAPKILSYYVSNSDPTKVIVKYDKPLNTLSVPDASAFTLAGKTISNVTISDSSVILTVTAEYQYLDVISLIYTKPALNPIETTKGSDALSFTQAITNNVISALMTLTSTGTGAGVSTMAMQVSSNITITLGANAKFYTDAAGTLGESSTWTITSGALRTIYLKCTTGTASAKISDVRKITEFGNTTTDGWVSSTNAASLSCNISKMSNMLRFRVTGTSAISGNPPSGLTYFSMVGAGITWTSSGTLPAGLTYLFLGGNGISWTGSGPLPSGIIILNLTGTGISWTHSGAFPTGITYLNINGSQIAWTGLDISGSGNITTFNLLNYRISKMSSADMITLLTNLTNRVGALPATVVINDYADYASPPAEVTNAVNTLKTTKSVTTVTLGQ